MRMELNVEASPVGVSDLGGTHDMKLATFPPLLDRHPEPGGALPQCRAAFGKGGKFLDVGGYREPAGRGPARALQDIIDCDIDDRQLVFRIPGRDVDRRRQAQSFEDRQHMGVGRAPASSIVITTALSGRFPRSSRSTASPSGNTG